MQSKILSRRDVEFMLYEWLDAEALNRRARFQEHSRETFDAAIDTTEQIAAELFAPHNKKSDQNEPHAVPGEHCLEVRIIPEVKTALDAFSAAGLMAAGQDFERGGMQLPSVVEKVLSAYVTAANVSTAAYLFLTISNANTLLKCGTPDQVKRYVDPMFAGRFFGTMCLSEPQAGSSLADVRTKATPDGADALGERYRLAGNKMWISGGDQDVSGNIVHLVLAKVPNPDGTLPEGTAGISLFIVPKVLPDGTRNDVTVAGLNHKMGYRGTANCLLNFGETGGAVGWIVGAPGEGLRQMFQMMNEARIGVGVGAAALGYRGHRLAVDYARERLQGRPAGRRSGPPVAIIEHPDVRRMLLQQKAYVEGALALCLYCARLVDTAEGSEADAALLGLLTPVAKTWPSEYGLAANDIAIQVHGGYGYTRDFDVEQLWRDNRLNPIHEGTTGVQGMDLVGRKILSDGAGLPVLAARIAKTAKAAEGVPALAVHARALSEAWRSVVATIEVLQGEDRRSALDNATAFLWAFGHVVVAWHWLDQAVAAAGLPDRDLADGKAWACRFFFECELPKVDAWLALVAARSDVASGAPERIF